MLTRPFLKICALLAATLMGGLLFFNFRPAPQPVVIGLLAPLSGDFEIFGQMSAEGAAMAVKEINDEGGVLGGRQLKLVLKDNETNPGVGLTRMKELVEQENASAVISVVSSASRKVLAEVAEKERIPLLYAIDYEGGECHRYVFYYSETPDHYIHPLLNYLMPKYGKRVYTFGYDYVWPHEIARKAKKTVQKNQGEVVGSEFTPFGVKDYKGVLGRIEESGADILLLAISGKDAVTFIRQFNASPLKGRVTISGISFNETHLNQFEPGELDGVYTCLHFMTEAKRPETVRFVSTHKKQFPDSTHRATYATESSYSMLKMYAATIDRAGALDNEKIIDLMSEASIKGGNGRVAMRDDHHVNMNMIIGRYQGNRLEPVVHIDHVIPNNQCIQAE